MERFSLKKSSLPAFLTALGAEYRIIAPKRVGEADVVYDDLPPGQMPLLEYVNSLLPPKSHFFVRRETLLTIKGQKRPQLFPPAEEKPMAIFGLRSCDATGLGFLQKFFAERGYDDETVTRRIGDSLRMTLACTVPGPDCFCVCCEGGPFLKEHFDLQFIDLGETFLVEQATEKGKAAISKVAALFHPVERKELAKKERLLREVDVSFKRRSYISRGIKKISLDRIPDATWEEWAKDCQGCGGCCFVCPTCSCFTVNDREVAPAEYRRERSWDACLYSGFTREASGHNPRATAGQRLKRRFFHKMSYQYIERMGRHGCVGCGRCVTTCMGGLDISNLLLRISDAS